MKLPLWVSLGTLSVVGIATASVALQRFSWSIVGGMPC